jgi:lipid-A-disaccharide synthase-like uncharacterized protein
VAGPTAWLTIGCLGQLLFSARFLVQWIVSEQKRNSVVPVVFWWLSLSGGTILLAYSIFRKDPVIIAGQAMGLVVYARNLMLLGSAKPSLLRQQKRMKTLANQTIVGS